MKKRAWKTKKTMSIKSSLKLSLIRSGFLYKSGRSFLALILCLSIGLSSYANSPRAQNPASTSNPFLPLPSLAEKPREVTSKIPFAPGAEPEAEPSTTAFDAYLWRSICHLIKEKYSEQNQENTDLQNSESMSSSFADSASDANNESFSSTTDMASQIQEKKTSNTAKDLEAYFAQSLQQELDKSTKAFFKEVENKDRSLSEKILGSIKLRKEFAKCALINTNINNNTLSQKALPYLIPPETDIILPNGILFYHSPNNEEQLVSEAWGRFGSTLKKSEKRKIMRLARLHEADIILWTYTSTMPDALAKQKSLASEGIKSLIVEIPMRYELEMARFYEYQSKSAFVKPFYFTANMIKQMMDPYEVWSRSTSIFKNQLVKPNKQDIDVAIKIAALIVALRLPVYLGFTNLPVVSVAELASIQILVASSLTIFMQSIDNLMKSRFLLDFHINEKEVLKRQLLINLPSMEVAKYVYASATGLDFFSLAVQSQLLLQLIIEGQAQSKYQSARSRYLSPDARQNIALYFTMPAMVLSSMSIIGLDIFKIYITQINYINLPMLMTVAYYISLQILLQKHTAFFEKLGTKGFVQFSKEILKEAYKNWKERRDDKQRIDEATLNIKGKKNKHSNWKDLPKKMMRSVSAFVGVKNKDSELAEQFVNENIRQNQTAQGIKEKVQNFSNSANDISARAVDESSDFNSTQFNKEGTEDYDPANTVVKLAKKTKTPAILRACAELFQHKK